jgi:dTDP-4-amino-4,6-dideoxygalactose transaminase
MEVALKAEHIGTKVYYHPPIHQQKVYRTEPPLVLPNTEWLTDRIICLPMYNDMDDLLLERITSAIRRIRDNRDAVRSAISGRAAVA